ncbi:MAG: undecaprenyl-diphosphatase [Thermosediminibacterales bacterium]|nr:undecaprenyl-diphosphatase [Thermosediminibacterales bacterium]
MTTKKKLTFSPLVKLGLPLTGGITVGLLLLLLFVKLAEDLLYQELGTFDAVVENFIRGFTSEGLTRVAIFVTNLGSAAVEISLLLVVGGFLYFRLKHIWEPVILTSSLAGGWILNEALKAIFHRSRPSIQHLVEVGGYSFPSGHAMVSAAFYGMLGYLLWVNMRKNSKPAWYVVLSTFVLIFAIGLSRIYLGVHFASDVLAGFAAGGAWLIACIIALHCLTRN